MGRKRKNQVPRRTRKRDHPKAVRVGVAWYTADQWKAVRDFASDPEKFEDTYEEWLSVAEKALKDIAAAGVLPEKVYLDAAKFEEWCQSNNKDNEASVRAEYASVLLHEKYQAENDK